VSSGQKRRIPANFPRMHYRDRAFWRHVARTVREFNAKHDGPWLILSTTTATPVPDPGNACGFTYRRWLPGDEPHLPEAGHTISIAAAGTPPPFGTPDPETWREAGRVE